MHSISDIAVLLLKAHDVSLLDDLKSSFAIHDGTILWDTRLGSPI
jgi:hypothetical protein